MQMSSRPTWYALYRRLMNNRQSTHHKPRLEFPASSLCTVLFCLLFLPALMEMQCPSERSLKDKFDQSFEHVPSCQTEGIIKHLTTKPIEYSSEPVCSRIFNIIKKVFRVIHEKSTLLSKNNTKLLFWRGVYCNAVIQLRAVIRYRL